MSDAGHDQVGCGVCGNPEGHDGVCPIGRELFELRQALEASRAETREARQLEREANHEVARLVTDLARSAEHRKKLERDIESLDEEQEQRLTETCRARLLLEKAAELIDQHEWHDAYDAFLAGRGGSPTARPAPASYKEAPPPAVTGGDFVPGVDGGPPTATPIVPIGGGGSPAEARWGTNLPKATHEGPLTIGDVELCLPRPGRRHRPGAAVTGKGTALELVEELERAARYVVDACRDHGLYCGGSSCECSGLAARLKARAERVREMERGALETAAMTTGDTVRLRVIRELCGADLGPLPPPSQRDPEGSG